MIRRRSTYSPRYLAKVLALAATVPPGDVGVHHVTVLHDEWCDRLKNPPGACNCNPDVRPLKGAS